MPFNYEEYQQKCDTLSIEELQKEWESYTRQIAGSSTSTATSVLCSPLTGGVSLIGLGLSAPRIHNARKKREIIEAKLRARGASHITRARDVAGSVALSGVVGGLSFGLLGPGADIVTHAAADGAALAIDHTVGGQIKKSGLKDIEMKKMQEQMQMQQQYQVYQQQYIGHGNVQMGGVLPPGSQYQPQPGQPINLQAGFQQQQWSGHQGGGFNLQSNTHQYQPMPPGQFAYLPTQVGDFNSQQPRSHQNPAAGEEKLPMYQQDVVPNYSQDTQAAYQSCFPEKTPAYTTQPMKNDSTIQTRPALTCKTQENEGGSSPRLADATSLAPTMEDELTFLRARIMQMELERQTGHKELDMSEVEEKPSIDSSNEPKVVVEDDSKSETKSTNKQPIKQENQLISPTPSSEVLLPANPQNEKPETSNFRMGIPQQPNPIQPEQENMLLSTPQTKEHISSPLFQTQESLQPNPQQNNIATSSQQHIPLQARQHQQSLSLNQQQNGLETSSKQYLPSQALQFQLSLQQNQQENGLETSSHQHIPPPPLQPQQVHAQQPLQSNPAQRYLPTSTEQYCSPPPLQSQQPLQQSYQYGGMATTSQLYFPPPPPHPRQVQNIKQVSPDQVQYQQQVYVSQYAPPVPQNSAYQAPISPQYHRQDSGYYSIASPLQQPTPSFGEYDHLQSQYNVHVQQSQFHGRNASVVSSTSYNSPPLNCTPSGFQPNVTGSGYFPQMSSRNQVNQIGNQQWTVQQAGGMQMGNSVQLTYEQPSVTQPWLMKQG